MNFPKSRLSRLRKNKEIRALIQENTVGVNDLITPIFVTEGLNKKVALNYKLGSRFSPRFTITNKFTNHNNHLNCQHQLHHTLVPTKPCLNAFQ